MSKFKLAVLDIAGTILEDKDFVAIAFVNAFQNFGVHLSVEEINPLMGFKKTEAIQKVLEAKNIVADEKKNKLYTQRVCCSNDKVLYKFF